MVASIVIYFMIDFVDLFTENKMKAKNALHEYKVSQLMAVV